LFPRKKGLNCNRVEFFKPIGPQLSLPDGKSSLCKTLLKMGDCMTSIDLKDAYFSVPMHESYQRFLRFIWGSKRYAFQGLPFGLSSTSRIFTKLLKPVAAFLRKQGYRIIVYLDDFLHLASSKEEAQHPTRMTLTPLQSLGFLINWTKSTLSPTQTITYLF